MAPPAVIGSLTERIRNAAGTRILLCPTAPIAMDRGVNHDLRLELNENGVAGSAGGVPLNDRPTVVFQEGE